MAIRGLLSTKITYSSEGIVRRSRSWYERLYHQGTGNKGLSAPKKVWSKCEKRALLLQQKKRIKKMAKRSVRLHNTSASKQGDEVRRYRPDRRGTRFPERIESPLGSVSRVHFFGALFKKKLNIFCVFSLPVGDFNLLVAVSTCRLSTPNTLFPL